ncbi:MAG: LamG-like jellyroll fold domain-containing protein [Flavobacteriales bacterium]
MKKFILPIFILLVQTIWAQIPSYVPVNGLLSYYPFNGSGNDESSNANHLTNNGAVPTTDRFNNANSAYSFNGSTQHLIRNTPTYTFNPNSTFTVSLWHNRNNISVVGIPIMHATTAAGNFIWIFQTGATNMQFGTNKQQAAWIWAQSTSTTNVWTHIVLVYDAGQMKLYKDNVVVATGTFTHTGVTTATLPLYVGRGVSGSYFSGKIDDIGIWNRCLSTCEINDLFTASNTLTTVSAGPNVYACNGGPVTLNGTGASTYIWSPNVSNGSSFVPSINQTYTLTGIDANGCSAWDQTDVLLQQYNIDAGANQTICQGNSVTLNAAGNGTFTWNNGASNGQAFVPLQSGYYTVNGISPQGCVANDSLLLTINPLPTVNAGNDTVICGGSLLLFNATGAQTYVWNNGIINGQNTQVNSTSTFTVTGTSLAGCSAQDSLTIIVNPIPNIIAGPDVNTCAGQYVTLNAVGGINLQWNNGVQDGVPFLPVSNGTYIVTGMSNDGCYGSDTLLLNYGNLPDLNAGPDQQICFGDEAILYGTGGIFMSWNNGVADSIPFIPTTTTTYVLTGASPEGCLSTDTVTIFVTESTSSTLNISAIDSYTLNGQTYTASGTYTQLITNAAGCDSLITLNLTLDFTATQNLAGSFWKLYPNPASDFTKLVIEQAQINATLQLFDSFGRMLAEQQIVGVETNIHLQNLPSGLYLIKIGTETHRLEVIR